VSTVEPDHNRVLLDAARVALSPLGLVQKGRSRIWLDDRTWHVIVVEFQPSSWSRGTFVNVGVMWLWDVKDYISFDYGPIRVKAFESAGAEDWPERCRFVAAAAATQVRKLRNDISDLAAAAGFLSADPSPGWPKFHAAVAAGLVGDVDRGRRLFDRLLAGDATYDWQQSMHAKAADFRSVLEDRSAFRERVIGEIQRSREAHRLAARTASEIEASLGLLGHLGGL